MAHRPYVVQAWCSLYTIAFRLCQARQVGRFAAEVKVLKLCFQACIAMKERIWFCLYCRIMHGLTSRPGFAVSL